ncbi:PREDICTED: proline-rich receptor-like protein kinase PERK2 [Vollenhovia emeryi]|uniref:proline-rich receptor-like protein kinase PERK2 n=1 Tax=Vollenhovia emeryi TaxID=411798 RepID=UPI0005F4E6D6|nr:PREDICTED: proline-rich receptor-like protein kinase PERK2 [Vollenhovia emeryi]
MGRSRRAGRKVQLRRLARAYASPGVFDRPLELAEPSLLPPPPYPQSLIRLTLSPPHAGVRRLPSARQPPRLAYPTSPDPCPVRTWAPRPPVTPAPRPPTAALATAPPAQPPRHEGTTTPGPNAPKATLALKRTKPCIVRIEALPQRIRLSRRPRKLPQETKDMPSLG